MITFKKFAFFLLTLQASVAFADLSSFWGSALSLFGDADRVRKDGLAAEQMIDVSHDFAARKRPGYNISVSTTRPPLDSEKKRDDKVAQIDYDRQGKTVTRLFYEDFTANLKDLRELTIENKDTIAGAVILTAVCVGIYGAYKKGYFDAAIHCLTSHEKPNEQKPQTEPDVPQATN